MFFLNQEINPATTSNPESKSKPKIKEHEHQTYKEKKKKTWRSPNQRAWTKANTGKWRLTQTQEEHRNPALKNIEIKTQAREVNLEKIKNPKYRNHNLNLQKIK